MKVSKLNFPILKMNLLLCALSVWLQVYGQNAEVPDSFQLVYHQDFSSPQSLYDFTFSDPSAWQLSEDSGKRSLELFGKSDYRGKVRSPFNIALLHDLTVGDFILEVELAQSGREYGHRDLCLFFGMENASNFYYVHMASVADDHANNIFLVNDEPRIKIADHTTEGTDWGATKSWHKARIVRHTGSGSIQVYFDDLSKPIMEATDHHFTWGRIGFGSFDDTGLFTQIKVWAPKAHFAKDDFFSSSKSGE